MAPAVMGLTITKPGPITRFTIASTSDGYEVIDADGRPVSNSYEHANTPMQIAADLNEAATRGRRSLARALARTERMESIPDTDELVA